MNTSLEKLIEEFKRKYEEVKAHSDFYEGMETAYRNILSKLEELRKE